MFNSPINLVRYFRVSAATGAFVWLIVLLPLPQWFDLPVESAGETWLIERLVLFAILVITPLTLSLVLSPDRDGRHSLSSRAAALIQPPAALIAVVSFHSRTGIGAAILSTGWTAAALLIALCAFDRLARRRSLLPVEELSIDAGLAYITAGGGWMFLSRHGLNPMGFSDTIVLLTAAHFHYAGFAAPILTGLAGRHIKKVRPSLRHYFTVAAIGVIAGPPLVATGITFSRAIEMASAIALSISLLMLSLLILFAVVPVLKQKVAQLLFVISANSVVVTMIFACLYAAGRYLGIETVTIPLMAKIHGAINAFGFVLCGLIAWSILAPSPDRT
jgi:hypothetical protein